MIFWIHVLTIEGKELELVPREREQNSNQKNLGCIVENIKELQSKNSLCKACTVLLL